MKKQKIIDQNAKQIDLYQMVPCEHLYMLHSVRIQQKTSTIFIRTPVKYENKCEDRQKRYSFRLCIGYSKASNLIAHRAMMRDE